MIHIHVVRLVIEYLPVWLVVVDFQYPNFNANNKIDFYSQTVVVNIVLYFTVSSEVDFLFRLLPLFGLLF